MKLRFYICCAHGLSESYIELTSFLWEKIIFTLFRILGMVFTQKNVETFWQLFTNKESNNCKEFTFVFVCI